MIRGVLGVKEFFVDYRFLLLYEFIKNEFVRFLIWEDSYNLN